MSKSDLNPARHQPVQARPAVARQLRDVSVVVPTYHEAVNLPHLIQRLEALRTEQQLDLELILVDDDSRDGTEELVAALALDWVQLIIRRRHRGLSAAVLRGLQRARKTVCVVMDADLSHPPEAIPGMLDLLEAGQEFVIGSRYVSGASTDENWGLFRWLNSKVATLLAWPFTRVRDPMAGFFAFRRAALAGADHLNPVGYKIGLELIVKCGFTRIAELPIHFADRQLGQSKLSLKQQFRYIQHLRRLLIYKYPQQSFSLHFLGVAFVGLLVNLVALTTLSLLSVPWSWAVAVAVSLALGHDFVPHRRLTFSHAKTGRLSRQLAYYIMASLPVALLNVALTVWLLHHWVLGPVQLAACAGALAVLPLHYLICRYVVFPPLYLHLKPRVRMAGQTLEPAPIHPHSPTP
ncbi:MAG: glycosyltransferase family 2 protein [Phycisphaeraceae bacterium]|nr:glycosyltransferase family 2 protein [Phycisphaeraceae bacterium]